MTPQNAPWDIEGQIVFSLRPFPDESADVYQIWCQSVQPFDSFSRLLNLWPPTPPPEMLPGVWRGDLDLACVHSQMNLPTCTKFGANRSSRLTDSPEFWIFDPLSPPSAPLMSRGAICLAYIYIHSQMDMQMCATFGANRSSHLTASPDYLICDTLPPPPNAPWGIEGRLVFSLCPFPDESADVNQSWCQSDSFHRLLNCWPPKTPQVPPLCLGGQLFLPYIHSHMNLHMCAKFGVNRPSSFGSFSRICAKVSSAFRRCTRWLAKTRQKITFIHRKL